MRVTNLADINLPLAVWLLSDDYDYVQGVENYISVTTLMKPLKQILLARRIEATDKTSDVQDYISRKLGHAIHDSIEKAWETSYARSMKLLGYPQSVIDRIAINPTDETLRVNPDLIPVRMEQRSFRKYGNYTIGGKYDMVADGQLYDNKSTSVYSWIFDSKDTYYREQGSLYRWIDDAENHHITSDDIIINFIFTDWSKAQARQKSDYPQKRVETKSVQLMTVEETDRWVGNKIALIEKYKDAPESEMPECTDEELWRSAPKYKYYSDPSKTDGRSTRNFDTLLEANTFMASKGGKGIVITVPGEVKACGYCPVFEICQQKEKYLT